MTMKQRRGQREGGYIALMTTVVISVVLLVFISQAAFTGWYTRFTVLGTEAKEQASALAEGCSDQALTRVISDVTGTWAQNGVDVTMPGGAGTCHIYPVQFNSPSGYVTVKTQAVVRGAYANLTLAQDFADIHTGTPAQPSSGVIIVQTVVNNNGTNKTPSDFTAHVSGTSPLTQGVTCSSTQCDFPGSATGVVVAVSAGSYSVSQNNVSGFSQVLSGQCTGTIAGGEVRTCTITNTTITTTLIVIANVTNQYGIVSNVPGDFPLQIDGNAATLGTTYTVTPGSHTVSATTLLGYTPSAWGYDCASNGVVNLNTGDHKICIINFADNPPPAPICADTVMMLDRTGSMSSSDLSQERVAANALVALYAGVLPPLSPPRLGVGSFGGLDGSMASVPTLGQLTTNYSNILSQITTMTNSSSFNGTDLRAAITAGTGELAAHGQPGKEKVLVIVSDGDPNQPTTGTSVSSGFFSPTADTQNASGELWSTPSGAYTQGGSDTSDPVSENDRHRLYNFNIASIPSNATIVGIEAVADAFVTTTTQVSTPASLQAPPGSAMSAPNNQWGSVSGAFVSDNIYATDTVSGHVEGYNNFGFSIPSNATITGIEVTTEAKVSGTGVSQTTSTLTPNGQGSDTAWNGSESDIDETGSVSCSSSDRIDSNNNGNRESVVISLSSVPDGSTVTSVQVLTSDQGSSGGQYQDFVRVDGGSRINSGTITVTSTSGCNSRTQTIDVPDFVKNSGTDLEVGVQKIGNTTVQIGSIRALVTYTNAVTGGISIALSSNNGGSWTSVSRSVSLDTTESVDTPSGNSSTDLWGRTWTPANFANGSFALRVTNTSLNGVTTSLDHVLVKVNYTAPSPSTALACNLSLDLSWNGGTSWTSQKTQTLSGSSATYTYGSPTDDWSGHTWVYGDFTNTNFRARIQASDPGSNCDNAAVEHVDWLRVQVSYTIPASPQEAALSAADAAKLAGTDIFTIYFGSGDPNFLAKLASGTTPITGHQPGSFNDPNGITNSSITSLPAATSTPNQFSNPNRAYASDNLYATNNVNGQQEAYKSFTLNIPPGASINGIQIDVEAKSTDSSGCQIGAALSVNGGTSFPYATSNASITSTSDRIYSFGGSTSLWGNSWTADQLNATNFVVRLQNVDPGFQCTNGATLSVDQVVAKVYYSVNYENGDGDNFFISPTAADMKGIFEFIGNQVCPAASNPAQTPPPTQSAVLVVTHLVNNEPTPNTGTAVSSDFDANVTGSGVSPATFSGSESGVIVTMNPGTYSITSSAKNGYTQSLTPTCNSTDGGTIVAGETRVCVVTYDDIPPPPPPPNLNLTPGTLQETP